MTLSGCVPAVIWEGAIGRVASVYLGEADIRGAQTATLSSARMRGGHVRRWLGVVRTMWTATLLADYHIASTQHEVEMVPGPN